MTPDVHSAHVAEPHLRKLQKALAEDITTRVHSADDLKRAIAASEILFGNSTAEGVATGLSNATNYYCGRIRVGRAFGYLGTDIGPTDARFARPIFSRPRGPLLLNPVWGWRVPCS